MRPARQTPSEVEAIAGAALGVEIREATYLAVGWGNQNWRVVDSDDNAYVVKFGPPESAPKWSATSRSYDIAAGYQPHRVPAEHPG